MKVETLTVNVTTVTSIIVACFALWFFITDLVEDAVLEAKIYAADLDIQRDDDVIEMYRFRIQEGIDVVLNRGRMEQLQDRVQRRITERDQLIAQRE